MSTDRRQPAIEPSNLAVLRARLKQSWGRLRQSTGSWIKDNKQLSIISATVLMLTIPVAAKVYIERSRAEAMRPTPEKMTTLLLEVLAALDAEEFQKAQRLAGRLDLAYVEKEQHTLVEFALGAIAADDADEYVGADRPPRFQVAVQHLKKSRELGFPYGREAQATFLLGKSLFHSGSMTESRTFLEESLVVAPERVVEIHAMLATAYQWGESPNVVAAIEHNKLYLKSDEISDDERQAATLLEAELSWKLGDVQGCSAAIDRIPANSAWLADATILRGRILLQEATQARAALTADADETARDKVREKFQETLVVLRRARQDPLNTRVIGKAMYLIGVCHLHLDETQAALDQLRRTSRVYENTPEGLAAGIEEADLLRRLGRHDDAISWYTQVFDGVGLMMNGEADNPWISREQFRTRALDACNFYIRRGEFQRATKLVDHVASLVQPARAAEMAAELRRDWARQVIEEAGAMSEPAASAEQKRGRRMLREAGLLYARAANLNFAERQYGDDVWHSAESYRLGHNFTASAKMYEEYMKFEAKRRRSVALVGLGECLLSLGRPLAALDVLKQCYEMMPSDVASYSARLLASRAYEQLGKPKEAESLLRENIAGNLLTPESKEWRESIFALGKLLAQQDRHDEAIKVLSEAVARYPDSHPAIEARYLIAEEFRSAAKIPQEKAKGDTIETARVAHLKQVQQYLTAAIEHYEDAQRILNRRQEREELTPLEQGILRNSYFAVGTSLVDLSRYEEAIRAYSTATNRYQHAPEVLDAFVQIAGCYRRLNKPLEARGTVRQAKVVLNRLPEKAPYEQATNMSRKQWVDLLDWLIML
jgi:tetratricopeptide (TPR) repeat protein